MRPLFQLQWFGVYQECLCYNREFDPVTGFPPSGLSLAVLKVLVDCFFGLVTAKQL